MKLNISALYTIYQELEPFLGDKHKRAAHDLMITIYRGALKEHSVCDRRGLDPVTINLPRISLNGNGKSNLFVEIHSISKETHMGVRVLKGLITDPQVGDDVKLFLEEVIAYASEIFKSLSTIETRQRAR